MNTQPGSPVFMFVFRGPGMAEPAPERMQAAFQKWMNWIESLKAKGVYLAGDPLEATPAKVLRGPRGSKVTDGPYAEAKEIVGGYMLIKTKTFDEAVVLARDCPVYERGGNVEVRQLMPI
jgi:hypothetical protein